MLISIKLCTHYGEVAEIPRMLQLSQFILGNSLHSSMSNSNNVDSFFSSTGITSNDSTDTLIVQFTDSQRFFWKGSQKANCLSVLCRRGGRITEVVVNWGSTV
jgi:hypothetical protein